MLFRLLKHNTIRYVNRIEICGDTRAGRSILLDFVDALCRNSEKRPKCLTIELGLLLNSNSELDNRSVPHLQMSNFLAVNHTISLPHFHATAETRTT